MGMVRPGEYTGGGVGVRVVENGENTVVSVDGVVFEFNANGYFVPSPPAKVEAPSKLAEVRRSAVSGLISDRLSSFRKFF